MTERPDISRAEFITLMAMIMATIAFSIDAVLPALPELAATLTPEAPNRAQLVITSFMFGMGLGTLVTGPISDAVGRKLVMVGGVLLYSLGAVIAWRAQSMEMMLAARALQGLGASGPRVVVMAMVRDKFMGSQMARIMSFVMVVFTLVPAIAPTAGAAIIAVSGWRAVFPAGMVFALVATMWLNIRQPETHTREKRRPLSLGALRAALIEVMGNRVVQTSILVQALVLGMMFGTISSVQSVIDQSFGRGDEFPMWFALVALLSAGGGFLNASLVVRLGMRRVASGALLGQVVLGAVFLTGYGLSLWPEAFDFPAYLLWVVSIFFMAGLTMDNLNALALEPMGHIAGSASSIISCLSTVLAVLIAAPIGLLFDGTPLPLAQAMLPCAAVALLLMGRMRRSA